MGLDFPPYGRSGVAGRLAALRHDDRDCGYAQYDARDPCRGEGLAEVKHADQYGRERLHCAENRGERRPDGLDGLHECDVGDGRGRDRQSENVAPGAGVVDPMQSRCQAARRCEQRGADGHDQQREGRRFDLCGAALAHADDIARVGDHRKEGRGDAERRVAAVRTDVARREQCGAGERNGDGREQPPRTAFAEKERHGQRDGQRIEEMNGRSDACGDVGIGEDEAQRTAGPEEAQQEDDAEIPAGDAQPPARRQPEEQQRRRGDAPAVGQHFER